MNTSERIYWHRPATGEPGSRLAAEKLARRIEDDIVALGLLPGTSLGSMRELTERYGQGRSVVREAVGLLERRGLGRMRPGPCGGFILAKPAPETIGAALARSLLRDAGSAVPALQDARAALELMLASADARPTGIPLLQPCFEHLRGMRSAGQCGDRTDAADAQQADAANPARCRPSIARRLAAEMPAHRTRRRTARFRMGPVRTIRGQPPDPAAGDPTAAGQWAGRVPARPRQWPGHPRPARDRQHPPGAGLSDRRAARPHGGRHHACSSSMPTCRHWR